MSKKNTRNKKRIIGKKAVATAFHFFVIFLLFIIMCITIMFFFWAVKIYNDKANFYGADSLKIGNSEIHTIQNANVNVYDFIFSNILYTKYDKFVNVEDGRITGIKKYRYNFINVIDSNLDKSYIFKTNYDRFPKIDDYLNFMLTNSDFITKIPVAKDEVKSVETLPHLFVVNRLDQECDTDCVAVVTIAGLRYNCVASTKVNFIHNQKEVLSKLDMKSCPSLVLTYSSSLIKPMKDHGITTK